MNQEGALSPEERRGGAQCGRGVLVRVPVPELRYLQVQANDHVLDHRVVRDWVVSVQRGLVFHDHWRGGEKGEPARKLAEYFWRDVLRRGVSVLPGSATQLARRELPPHGCGAGHADARRAR